MDLEILVLREVRKTRVPYDITHVESKNRVQVTLSTKQPDHGQGRADYGWRRGEEEVWDWWMQALPFGVVSCGVLPYSTGS